MSKKIRLSILIHQFPQFNAINNGHNHLSARLQWHMWQPTSKRMWQESSSQHTGGEAHTRRSNSVGGVDNPDSLVHKYRQFIKCTTRESNILDHCYTTVSSAYPVIPHTALGFSDHVTIHLIPAYRQKNFLNLCSGLMRLWGICYLQSEWVQRWCGILYWLMLVQLMHQGAL